ncbi:MAG: DivIVA domain-containing protein [Propionibacteriaceae bacterium]|jgi:DivIVA domain-containing protein|nr:DivIVA domain-containing protein [Propionibacteriaceae bacterium]
MEWLIAIGAVVVLGLAAVAASGRLGQFGPAQTDRPEPAWPDAPLTAADVDSMRFAVVPRGYAMDQIDHFLDLVRDRLAELEGQPIAAVLGAEALRPGIMGPDRVPNPGEVMTDHGSDEAPDRRRPD